MQLIKRESGRKETKMKNLILNRDNQISKEGAVMALYHIAEWIRKNHLFSELTPDALEKLALEIHDHESLQELIIKE